MERKIKAAEITNLKKYVLVLLVCFACMILLSACGEGNTSNVKTHKVDSKMYSQEEITAAIDVIEGEFTSREWKGCTLKEIYYAGDEESKNCKDWAERNNADDVIVLMSTFTTSSTADSSLNPNDTYDNWEWILVRTKGGKWKHVDHGYG